MRTQLKLLLILFVTLGISITTVFIVYFINRHDRNLIRNSQIIQLDKNIDALVTLNAENMKEWVNDYTFWDDMVEFVYKSDTDWAAMNLETMIQSFKVDAVWVISANNEAIYFVNKKGSIDFGKISFSDSTLNVLHKDRFLHYYKYIDSHVLEIEGATIHPTNDQERKTNPHGYLLIARIWDRKFIGTMEKVSETKMHLIPATKHEQLNNNFAYVASYWPLLDEKGKTVCYLKSEKELKFLSIYHKASRNLIIIFILSALLTIGIFAYATTVLVNRPLHLIENILNKKDNSKILLLKRSGKEFRRIGILIQSLMNKNHQLQLAKLQADNANKVKTSFLCNINHEIRTPVNGIVGFSELLIESKESQEVKEQYARLLKESCNNLVRIFEDIIDISQITNNEIKVHTSQFHAAGFAAEQLIQFKEFAKDQDKSHLQIEFTGAWLNPDLNIHSDKMLLRKILYNLVGNAIKFTKYGNIEIGLNLRSSDWPVYYVKDSGIGIIPEKLPIIFDQFRQVDESISRIYGGNGIGLSICKGLVHILGGTIWVESEVDKGSTFYFSIPS